MLKKILFPGKYMQGPGALNELPSLKKTFGRQGLILASPTAHKKVLLESGMDLDSLAFPVERFSGECCEKELGKAGRRHPG